LVTSSIFCQHFCKHFTELRLIFASTYAFATLPTTKNFFSVFHLERTSFSAFRKKSKCAVIDYFKFISRGEQLNVEYGEGEEEGESNRREGTGRTVGRRE
jgi:hypothetical protein